MEYREYLESKLSDVFPCGFVYPSGYDLVGHVVLLDAESDDSRYLSALGIATLEFEKRAESVAVRSGPTAHMTRRPSYQVVAGNTMTETVHTEDGVRFKLDPLQITFSGGNSGERIRVKSQVQPGETIVDLFACVGQFALHAAMQDSVRVIAIEINEVAFDYLVENVTLNGVEGRVCPVLGDCRSVHPVGVANRIYMGFLHDTISYLPHALETLTHSGGTIHMHMAHPMNELAMITERIAICCRERGFCSRIAARRVKSYAPGITHMVYDIVAFEEQ